MTCDRCDGRGWVPAIRSDGLVEAERCHCEAGQTAEVPANLGSVDQATAAILAVPVARLKDG